MGVKVAIHGKNGFARRWPESVHRLGGEVRYVNGYDPRLFDQLEGCDAFLWHINQDNPRDLLYARSILASVEGMGIRVYPNHATSWHFDDKIAQKYLLESVGAPLAETWVFFDKEEANDFLRRAKYPLVFKLRRGAGALNVRLVRTREEGFRLVRRMFGAGIRVAPPVERMSRAIARVRNRRQHSDPLWVRAMRAGGLFLNQTLHPLRERGYVLFQKFVPDNDHDIRVTVIGARAFVYRREVRKDDFRASGSGKLIHLAREQVPFDAVEIAHKLSRRLGFQSMAYDFVRDGGSGQPLLLEMSFGFVPGYVYDCLGHLTCDQEWIPGHLHPEDLIVEDLLSAIKTREA